jgi:hypothetical protein
LEADSCELRIGRICAKSIRTKSCERYAFFACVFGRIGHSSMPEIMALSEHLCNIYALETTLLLARRRAQKRRQQWVNDILSKKPMFGEFSHMWNDLEKDESQYFGYFLMKYDIFQYILNKVQDQLKKYSNFRETISPEERLAVTLR